MPKAKTPQERKKAFAQIMQACQDLGWIICTERIYSEGEPLEGLILGTKVFLERNYETEDLEL